MSTLGELKKGSATPEPKKVVVKFWCIYRKNVPCIPYERLVGKETITDLTRVVGTRHSITNYCPICVEWAKVEAIKAQNQSKAV